MLRTPGQPVFLRDDLHHLPSWFRDKLTDAPSPAGWSTYPLSA